MDFSLAASISSLIRELRLATAARQGETGCKGRSIPMEKLDDLVAQHLEERLLDPQRLEAVLAGVLDNFAFGFVGLGIMWAAAGGSGPLGGPWQGAQATA